MAAHVFTGHYCPTCKTSIGLAVGLGAELRCPGCGGPFQAAPGGPKIPVVANVACKKCGFAASLKVGGDDNCPSCGEPLRS